MPCKLPPSRAPLIGDSGHPHLRLPTSSFFKSRRGLPNQGRVLSVKPARTGSIAHTSMADSPRNASPAAHLISPPPLCLHETPGLKASGSLELMLTDHSLLLQTATTTTYQIQRYLISTDMRRIRCVSDFGWAGRPVYTVLQCAVLSGAASEDGERLHTVYAKNQ